MEPLFDEKMIRNELKRLDTKTGLHGADLPIRFGNAKRTLGQFSYPQNGEISFYFSNYYFMDPNFPIEEKLDTIRHEYAHYMDYTLNGSSSHGPEWKRCCSIVGAHPSRHFCKERSDAYLAKHERERLLNEKYDKYAIGSSIVHPIFGCGEIVEVLGTGINRVACVSFKNGTKRIAVNWIDSQCTVA